MFRKMNIVSLVLMICLTLALTACAGAKNTGSEASTNSPKHNATESNGESKSEPSALPPVELTWYYPGTPQKDVALIQEAMNKITKEEINATIKLITIDWASYTQKLNVMQAGGDEFDLAFVAPWVGNFYQGISKGAYLPLDDLLEQYAPTLKSTVPDKIWDAAKVGGQIYGAINWQIVAGQVGIEIRKDLADKYNLNMDSIQKVADLEPFLTQVSEGEENSPYIFVPGSAIDGFDNIGDDGSPGVIRIHDDKLTVFNQFESDEYREFVELMHSWYNKGLIRKDQSTLSFSNEILKSGSFAGVISYPIKPGVEIEDEAKWGQPVLAKSLTKALITTNKANGTMTAISKTSKNPERAMMFLELINTNKELYNLICHGIEGVHYTKVSENLIQKNPDNTGYNPLTDWMFGNQFNSYYTDPAQVGAWEKTEEMNLSADISPILGFSFDPENVKTELAQVNTVVSQYAKALDTGSVDPAVVLDEFIAKLKEAGSDKIIAEKQKQLDLWLGSK
ncbi:hypothetical protein B1748_30770 [Paenibacillus sp. MY03]|uniref:ABC transporter substrate-binding protein n=1 Tax=Paenibacillus sp. MY03 TaxID=302980 RepID=UPI000B3C068E|nr:ABC transporter substrate-binding protein [Paenibacillus sp. MY03]OUS69721.1 hypothetical protein B1748_30770 [Paenibacillus sp. MY03]